MILAGCRVPAAVGESGRQASDFQPIPVQRQTFKERLPKNTFLRRANYTL